MSLLGGDMDRDEMLEKLTRTEDEAAVQRLLVSSPAIVRELLLDLSRKEAEAAKRAEGLEKELRKALFAYEGEKKNSESLRGDREVRILDELLEVVRDIYGDQPTIRLAHITRAHEPGRSCYYRAALSVGSGADILVVDGKSSVEALGNLRRKMLDRLQKGASKISNLKTE